MLPGEVPESVGDLLRLGLERAGVTGVVHGLVTNPEATLEQIKRENINVLVGIPTQVLSLAKLNDSKVYPSSLNLRSVLLSTDYVVWAIVQKIDKAWRCPSTLRRRVLCYNQKSKPFSQGDYALPTGCPAKLYDGEFFKLIRRYDEP